MSSLFTTTHRDCPPFFGPEFKSFPVPAPLQPQVGLDPYACVHVWPDASGLSAHDNNTQPILYPFTSVSVRDRAHATCTGGVCSSVVWRSRDGRREGRRDRPSLGDVRPPTRQHVVCSHKKHFSQFIRSCAINYVTQVEAGQQLVVHFTRHRDTSGDTLFECHTTRTVRRL